MTKYQDEIIQNVKDVAAYPGLMEVQCESGEKYSTFDITYKGKVGMQCLIAYTEHPYTSKNGKQGVNKRIVPANAKPMKPSVEKPKEVLQSEINKGFEMIVLEKLDKILKILNMPF